MSNIVLDAKVPEGPLADKWSKARFDLKLVNPANKRKYEVVIVGSGLAGASAAATLGECPGQFEDEMREASTASWLDQNQSRR